MVVCNQWDIKYFVVPNIFYIKQVAFRRDCYNYKPNIWISSSQQTKLKRLALKTIIHLSHLVKPCIRPKHLPMDFKLKKVVFKHFCIKYYFFIIILLID